MQALTVYKLFAADSERTLADISRRPQVSREVEYYRQTIDGIDSAEALVSDRRVLDFVMRAYGLEELSYAKALVRKVLEEGIDDPEALANQMTDPRFKELAADFNFARYGETTTTFERTRSGVIDKYLVQTMEIDAGNQNDGARLAMYFERKAEDITTAYDILADPALLQVVQTVFQLPAEMSFRPIEDQAEMIDQRLDITELSDPQKVDELIDRFLPLWDLSNAPPVTIPPLISGAGGITGFSVDLLASLQNFKKL
ncbi:DUF1217 domain-containing protein [Salaquimonas pukyongi]|uniref:DUF1217 domain-containing protein n=1 Tax=Salaquimonas pukyongi TaxID=2712698 RepID=UPI0009F88B69|nr:DUF1217 domain-containing protein [Salaquimonas pukyongi]